MKFKKGDLVYQSSDRKKGASRIVRVYGNYAKLEDGESCPVGSFRIDPDQYLKEWQAESSRLTRVLVNAVKECDDFHREPEPFEPDDLPAQLLKDRLEHGGKA